MSSLWLSFVDSCVQNFPFYSDLVWLNSSWHPSHLIKISLLFIIKLELESLVLISIHFFFFSWNTKAWEIGKKRSWASLWVRVSGLCILLSPSKWPLGFTPCKDRKTFENFNCSSNIYWTHLFCILSKLKSIIENSKYSSNSTSLHQKTGVLQKKKNSHNSLLNHTIRSFIKYIQAHFLFLLLLVNYFLSLFCYLLNCEGVFSEFWKFSLY